MPDRGGIEGSISFVQDSAADRSVKIVWVAEDQTAGSCSNGSSGANELNERQKGQNVSRLAMEFNVPRRYKNNVDIPSMTEQVGIDDAQVCI